MEHSSYFSVCRLSKVTLPDSSHDHGNLHIHRDDALIVRLDVATDVHIVRLLLGVSLGRYSFLVKVAIIRGRH